MGIVVIAANKGDRKTALPFGPFMITAALVAVFVGPALTHWYHHLTRT